jgi:hypothetical protein
MKQLAICFNQKSGSLADPKVEYRSPGAAIFISIILGSAKSDLYWSVGATFIQIIDESAFIHPNVCTFIQNRAIPP